jgi:hypothetical protein
VPLLKIALGTNAGYIGAAQLVQVMRARRTELVRAAAR